MQCFRCSSLQLGFIFSLISSFSHFLLPGPSWLAWAPRAPWTPRTNSLYQRSKCHWASGTGLQHQCAALEAVCKRKYPNWSQSTQVTTLHTLLVCREKRSPNQSHSHGRVLPPWPHREGHDDRGSSQLGFPLGRWGFCSRLSLIMTLRLMWCVTCCIIPMLTKVISLLFSIDSFPSPSQASLQNASK